MGSRTLAFSAPGKVLLAGGYLVLDREYTGLVFGLDARIHVHVRDLNRATISPRPQIVVQSPQFKGAEWLYRHHETEAGGIKVTQVPNEKNETSPRNKFVETALEYALTYAQHAQEDDDPALHITILADTDYYSKPNSLEGINSTADDRFIDLGVPIEDAHKTGLGSSAALVTALTAAVSAYLIEFDQLDTDSVEGRRRIHNLAQAAHCAAQGKIGSGFDVAAAVYGSCVYRRFSPSILEKLGEVDSDGFTERLEGVVDDTDSSAKWDVVIDEAPAVIPPGLLLMMCDIDCGSETVGMVKKVLAWRFAQKAEADLLWATLQKGNEDLAHELQRLSQKSDGSELSYQSLKDTISTIRSLIREMSTKSGVPIEPEISTELIDTCSKVPGVIGGVVPGAGGFDAVALLLKDDIETVTALQKVLDGYQSTGMGSGQGIKKARLLGVKQDSEGFKLESLAKYRSWLKE